MFPNSTEQRYSDRQFPIFQHDVPQRLDGIEIGRMGGQEMQLDAAARPLQPLLDRSGAMGGRIVENDMNAAFAGIMPFQLGEKGNGGLGCDLEALDQLAIAIIQTQGCFKVQALAALGAAHGDLVGTLDPDSIFGTRPASAKSTASSSSSPSSRRAQEAMNAS